jgi:protein-S-isoprenylcysteine O-methyltransferase Ste14
MRHRLQQIAGIVINTALFAFFLLVPAQTLHWRRVWILLGINAVCAAIVVIRMPQDLLKERMKGPVQQGQPVVDKVILISFMASFAAVVAFIPIDRFHLHLLPVPPLAISIVGLLIYMSGLAITGSAALANAFAAPVVRLQKDRSHHVVDTGPYRFVRHPMYAGLAPIIVGMALWLGSWAAAIAAIVPIALIAIRAVFEEKFLVRELSGYDDFTRRTRFRLIPYVW